MQNFFGIRIDELTNNQLIQKIADRLITKGNPSIFTNHNLHSLYLCLRDKSLAAWINSQHVVHADGMGIVYLGKLFGKPLNREHRVTYVDFMPLLLEYAQAHKYRAFYLGSNQASLNKGLMKIKSLYPSLAIYGCNGYDLSQAIDSIERYKPDILFVGMGMPRQEKWIIENINKLNCKVILPCGAAMDYYSGFAKTPPRWAGRIGLEWAFRLLYDPLRLWKRYILEPFYILIRLLLWKFWK